MSREGRVLPWEPPSEGLAVGVLSGTSADGIDTALIRVAGGGDESEIELLESCTSPYPPDVSESLSRIFGTTAGGPGEIARLHAELGEAFGISIRRFLQDVGVPREKVVVVGSHGQTVYHEPPPGRGVTMQLGEPATIAALTKIPVVDDFRSMDMALGGQGAPLIPYFDWVMLTHEQLSRCAVNLGGIGNLTYLPAGAGVSSVMAFDTGPGNMVLDGVVRRMTEGRLKYDAGGEIALSGCVDADALQGLMKHPFLSRTPPRSAGRREFGEGFVSQLWEPGGSMPWSGLACRMDKADLVATLAAWTAACVVSAVAGVGRGGPKVDQVIVGGGGAHNGAVMRRLRKLLPGEVLTYREMEQPLMGEAREACAFAFYAWEFLGQRPVNIPEVTGADAPAVLGSYTLAPD